MRVVNVHGLAANDPAVVYVGRDCAGWTGSPLANPFIPRGEWERDAVLLRYEDWLWGRLVAGDGVIRSALDALPEDALLGCWCHPKPCHAGVIARVAGLLRFAGPVLG